MENGKKGNEKRILIIIKASNKKNISKDIQKKGTWNYNDSKFQFQTYMIKG